MTAGLKSCTTTVVVGALLLIGCGRQEKEPEPVVPVQVAPAIRGSIRQVVTADAILYPRDQASIVPKIGAPVRRFLVNRGDHVKKDQLLAELENRDLRAAETASRGQYGQAAANYQSMTAATLPEEVTKAQTDVDSARQALDATQKLLDSREQLFKEGALARKLVDEAQVSYAQAKAQFETAQQHLSALQNVGRQAQTMGAAGQLESARGQYESAQAQVSYSEIRSPLTGVVTDRPIYPGEMATTGAPLLTVMDVASVIARVNLTPEQAKAIKVGVDATLSVGEGDDTWPGKVIVVSPAVDPNSTTVQVWVQADNPGERLRAGTSVHVAIVAATLEGVTLVPQPALLPSEEGGTMVIVVDDQNVAHQKKVDVGVRDNGMAEIVAGVQPGDRVVTVGGLGLEDKAKVRVLKPGEKQPGQEDEKDEDEK